MKIIMKIIFRFVLVFALACICPVFVFPIDDDFCRTVRISLGIIDETKDVVDTYKCPVFMPSVAIDGHTLFLLNSGCDDSVIKVYGEDGQEVFSIYVRPGTDSIELPECLTGIFELRIIRGRFTFIGEFELE